MSYLDVPRLHFAGTFTADPSTINNTITNYDPANRGKLNLSWNPYGSHAWTVDCEVTAFIDAAGQLHTGGDPVIGAPLQSYAPRVPAKLVDLDTDQQTTTRLFGFNVQLGTASSALLRGLYQDEGTLLALWFSRVQPGGGDSAASGAFQSILKHIAWGDLSYSPLLQQLQQAAGEGLSIRLTTYGYQDDNASPGFHTGSIVGTIGREREFSRAFLPREESLRGRWDGVRDLAEGNRGFDAVDLLTEKEWPLAEAAGLTCSMAMPTERRDFIRRGLNDRANHPLLLGELKHTIVAAKRRGYERVIAMIGNREERSDTDGLAACAEGLRQVVPLAEEQGITICLELLNSRVDHHDFMGDRMAFGLQLMYTVNSPRVRLLYDIYHMQIMEGDVIHTIRTYKDYIGHYHTGGVPGRAEIDETQAAERFWESSLPTERDTLAPEWVRRLLDRPRFVLHRGDSPIAAAEALQRLAISLR